MESDFAAALEDKGYKTVKSIDVLPPTFTDGEKPDRAALLSKRSTRRADAILTVALINKETERVMNRAAGYAPMPRFGYLRNLLGLLQYLVLYNTPGYYQEDKVYFIETNLYDAESEQLLWSAQSETYNPSSLTSFAKKFR